MPDWFYRTVSRPLLFRLPAPAARDFALGVMGTLARLPLGPAVIDLLGHMRPDPRLGRTHQGVTFPSPLGLAPGLDMHGVALPALARFGLGFLELGPVTATGRTAAPAVARREAEGALYYPEPPVTLAADDVARQLARVAPLPVPMLIRLGADANLTECREIMAKLAPYAAFFVLPLPEQALKEAWPAERWQQYVRAFDTPRPLLLGVGADLTDAADQVVCTALTAGAAGILIDGSVHAEPAGRLTGLPARGPALQLTRRLRERCGKDLFLIASGGIHEPEDALRLLAAGADLVQVDSGLVYSGPGLPKRINEAILWTHSTEDETPVKTAPRPAEMSWFWTTLMGTGMLIGGILTLAVAATRVVLPYDEGFVGMTRDQLAAINERLLAFMAHDRVSLAGTMVAIGALYLGLSLSGSRRGLHWAQVAVCASAWAGFGSFFLFLGFEYFDPFHAFVTAILFQFLLLGIHARLGPPAAPAVLDLREDWRWRWSQWGQFLFVLQGCGLLGGGLVISAIGATHVFVHEDLDFMQTTRAALAAANPRLIPLIAHDRASFGGMLVASGLVVLLTALWGFRRGERWLWWTLLAGGTPAYAAGIGVHLAVGYTDAGHLAPAFLAAGLYALGLVLSRPFLCQDKPNGMTQQAPC